jgi:hypothetical protein
MEDASMLEMALVGFQIEKQRIEGKIQDIEAQLRGRRSAAPSSSGASDGQPAVKRQLSPAARKRIAAAQKRRWAEHRKRAAQAAKAAKSGSGS